MGHRFKKQFGQNFLKSNRFVNDLLDSITIEPDDFIIEIGPGDGRVTDLLLRKCERVTSVEVDYDLLAPLIKRFGENINFDLIHEDIMEFDINAYLKKEGVIRYKVTGSLPYNISKRIINKFILDTEFKPEAMSFIVQDEVAKSYASKEPKRTKLSAITGIYTDIKKGLSIPKQQFHPMPAVNGGIITFTNISTKREIELEKLIKIGFSKPRKTLRNNLLDSNKFAEKAIELVFGEYDSNLRPAQLTVEDWKHINKIVNE